MIAGDQTCPIESTDEQTHTTYATTLPAGSEGEVTHGDTVGTQYQ